ncbi:MAG: hydroxymethylglutaryl-CoA reductase, degradative [Croceitalea sp.]|nr:hydroxymethylglutaryl-CoA reductase, degradative [Croceitalea sp.]
MLTVVEGFSKFSKEDKIDWIAKNCTSNADETKRLLKKYWNENPRTQRIHDEFIENTLSNYYLPFAVAPNFKINEKLYTIPMAIEESSVVAAASKAAKFWLNRGGFKTTVLGTEKVGQVHFMFDGNKTALRQFFDEVKPLLFETTSPITQSMTKRGGGIQDIVLIDKTQLLSDYYQLHCTFETVDAMGANFINSCLEQISKTFEAKARLKPNLLEHGENLTIVMSILSNYVPNCIVRAEVSCKVEELNDDELKASLFAEKMIQAVNIAKVEPYRAVTHNKGIMNGIDAVILATGNDFRAVEAGIHAYASKNGVYSSLTHAEIKDGVFKFWMEIPLALGTVGGLTSLHPLVKLALEILQQPTAKELMQIVAVAGLAQNFAALRSLVTTGIQKGHMKMHLLNMLSQMGANEQEKNELVVHFKDKTVNNANVRAALQKLQAK